MATTPKSISGLTSAAAARVVLWQSREFVTVPGNAMGLVTTDSVSAYMLTLLDDANAAAARATLGIDEQRRNRIVNGAMQISQENGDTAATTNGYYVADQWFIEKSHSAGTMTAQRVQSVTPNGSKDRFRITITSADASLAAGEYLMFSQRLEGLSIADFGYGLASASQTILRFGFKGPAGTYAIASRNAAGNRSHVALFTITGGQANTDTEQVIVIPGDTTGTWVVTSGHSISLNIVLASGSTFQGTTGWQAGNIIGTSAVSNGMGTGSAVFELFDVGLYLDDMLTGIPPRWEMPAFDAELYSCKRYFHIANGVLGGYGIAGVGVFYRFPNVPMRVTPSITLITTAGTVNITGATISAVSTEVQQATGSITATGGFILVATAELNARM